MVASVVYGIGCMLPPSLAWLIISQDWSFNIPIIGVQYNPWRLYLLVAGLPGLLAGLALLKFPESPKYMFGQGKQDETIEILKTIYSWNTGNDRNTLKVCILLCLMVPLQWFLFRSPQL